MTDTAPSRIGALDLLRGVTIAAMIVVNNPGNWNSIFAQLAHEAWNGVTIADLIFPTFIFIMGVAMATALASRGAASNRARLVRRIAWRAAALVLLGLVLNVASAWPALHAVRIPGVLQRIGITYFVAALITIDASDRQQWMIAGGLLLVHWGLLVLPLGLPMGGQLEPGQNVGVALDRALFGSHLLTPTGDPEGALGLLSSISTALFGAAIGRWLLQDARARAAGRTQNVPGTMARLLVAGAVAIAVGAAWSAVLPLNKALWTASFAVLACGVATLSLVLFTWVDRRDRRGALAPLSWLGTNPLAIYFLSELLTNALQRPWLVVNGQLTAPKDWVYWDLLVPVVHDNGGPWSSLTYALLYTLLWIGVAGLLRWRGIRFRV